MKELSFYSKQKGFTLIELMVAITLGLIVIGAAMQLFVGGVLSSRLQQANAEIQDSGIFGLDYVVRDIRFANQDNLANLVLTDKTPYGGIVLTGSTASDLNTNFIPKVSASSYVDDALLSRGQGDAVSGTNDYWKGLVNVTLKNSVGTTIANPVSDQLTIQFFAPSNMVNCEGANVLRGDLVVQRYFLRPDANGASSTDYALTCDANTPAANAAAVTAAVNARTIPDETTNVITPLPITGLGNAGQIIMPRVDHFHVLLGTQTTTTTKTTVRNTSVTPATVTTTSTTTNQFAYYTIPQYRAAAAAARTASTETTSGSTTTKVDVTARILSTQISVLVRSANNVQNTAIEPSQSFVMLDQSATPSNTTTRVQRRVYTTTVALRNAMGEPL